MKTIIGYNLVYVQSARLVGYLGDHKVYGVDNVQVLPFATNEYMKSTMFTSEQRKEDERYRRYFNEIPFSRDFFFSYTLDLTRTLLINITTSIRNDDYGEIQDNPPPQHSYRDNSFFNSAHSSSSTPSVPLQPSLANHPLIFFALKSFLARDRKEQMCFVSSLPSLLHLPLSKTHSASSASGSNTQSSKDNSSTHTALPSNGSENKDKAARIENSYDFVQKSTHGISSIHSIDSARTKKYHKHDAFRKSEKKLHTHTHTQEWLIFILSHCSREEACGCGALVRYSVQSILCCTVPECVTIFSAGRRGTC